MQLIDCEENFRRFIHVEALLKHFAPSAVRNPGAKVFSMLSTQKLIEYASRSQAGKWREYARSQNDGSDCSPRIDAS